MHPLALVLTGVLSVTSTVFAVEPQEDFLRNLPPGVRLQASEVVPANQVRVVEDRLGGSIRKLSRSQLLLHGTSVQVNAVTAATSRDAGALHAALAKLRAPDYCLREGSRIIEFVGRHLTPGLAAKASWELGLAEKPKSVTYRIRAELATVDAADYMACNPLFTKFLAHENGAQVGSEIAALRKRFTFGRTLVLRSPTGQGYRFTPAASGSRRLAPFVQAYTFGPLPTREGVPFVTVEMELSVDDDGLQPGKNEPDGLATAATPRWPADDPGIRRLAQEIVRGKRTNPEKAAAVLAWIATNLKYRGETGSRWGTGKVLVQKFGHCWDFSDCFVTLARAAGVPSRQVAGWLFAAGGHVWAEFWHEETGWQQVDPTGGGQLACGIYHLPWFTSQDGEMPILYLSMPKVEMQKPR